MTIVGSGWLVIVAADSENVVSGRLRRELDSGSGRIREALVVELIARQWSGLIVVVGADGFIRKASFVVVVITVFGVRRKSSQVKVV